MGFLDNVLKKVGTKLATRCGVVRSGAYEGASLAMGTPPTNAKIATVKTFSQIVFIKNDEEIARFDINKDVIDLEYRETIKFPETGRDGYRCKLTFANGDTCDVDLFPSQLHMTYPSLIIIMKEETFDFFKKEAGRICRT